MKRKSKKCQKFKIRRKGNSPFFSDFFFKCKKGKTKESGEMQRVQKMQNCYFKHKGNNCKSENLESCKYN